MSGNSLWRICSALSAAALMNVAAAAVQAAPITFAFDAVISDITDPGNIASQLPFQPSIGEPIAGSVTFSPVAFGQVSGNDALLKITIRGETVSSQMNKVTTINDQSAVPGAPVDGISVECGVSNACATGSFANPVFELSLVFSSLQDALSVGAPLDSLQSWNIFENRKIELVLSDQGDTVRMSIIGDVGMMRVVPEPAAALLFVAGAGWLLIARSAGNVAR